MSNAHDADIRPGRLLLLLPLQAAGVAGLGLLVTGPLAGRWPLSAEDGLNRALAAGRGVPATTFSDAASLLAGTGSVIVLTLLACVALLCVPHAPRWREAAFLAVSVAAQSAVFVLVTMVVERPRPDVPHLDGAPPTSSFPSGHVGASVALFGGLAVLAAARLRGARRTVVVGLLLLLPLAVAGSRVYRGMHHPSDVVAGLLNGACTLLVVGYALLPGTGAAPGPTARRGVPAVRPGGGGGKPSGTPRGRVVVVRHPHACGSETAASVRAVLRRHGYADQVWAQTSADEPCGPLAAHMAEADTSLVVVCGGDGTVRACAEVLAGTGIPLAIAPCGTGNLLARNLGLPSDPAAALQGALSGQSVGLDVGRVDGDGLTPTRFVVMAGAGFDAAMVRDASDRLKERLGWVAYVVAALRHLRDPRMRLSIRLDGGAPLERRARMAVIGNVGSLQGGLPLLPDARPDSGRLELVLLDPRGPGGWLAAAGHLASRTKSGSARPAPGGSGRRAAHGALEYFSAARIELRFARAQPRELDGDAFPAGRTVTAEVEPGALRVCLPAPVRDGTPEVPAADGTERPAVTDGAQGAAALAAGD
ncbi:diacylglycerol kinase family protein [Streptomyces sp. NPDC051582]|uniref:diacylglycerol kinase family protein n=1 Tax=Streptomyces sp. NPDC051582 TaxID=3155167 RepID=UPI003427493B